MNESSIGARIKAARKAAGKTQAQLAELIGCATITIRQYEADKRLPSIIQMRRIATALDVYVADLVEGHWNQFTVDESAWTDDNWDPKQHGALVSKFNLLNKDGQSKLLERLDELMEIPKYCNQQPAQKTEDQ